jgi:N-acetylmuramoyl-L-alanine amidase
MLPSRPSSGGMSLSQQVGLQVRTVVIDPGHGGSDPGAIGPTGLQEKDVTLKVAKRVAARLEKELGLNVVLTRDRDKTLSLEERAAIANDARADLFVSVHVNASPNRKAYGIETFYLNTTDDRYAIRLAARENAGSEKSIGDLQFILADLVTKSNVDDSRRLARAVQSGMVAQTGKRYSDVKDLGLKSALFYVLIGVRMPSVLVETSFISNRREEKRLRQDAYLDALADGIVRGVREFTETQTAAGS